MENVHIKSWIKTDTTEMAHSGAIRFKQRKTMIQPDQNRNRSVQVPDFIRFGLCLIGDESKALTKFQTKLTLGDWEKP